MNKKKIAIVYDRANKWGGAERILLALHRIFPDAPLFTSVFDQKLAKWASKFNIYTSFLQMIPLAKSRHEFFALFMPIAFENFVFDEFDVVISITSESAKGIITKPHTKHICICLTPTRYLWSGYKDYFSSSMFKLVAKPAIRYLRWWDKIAAHRPDVYIAISKEVKERIKKYYERESILVYPPLTIRKTRNTQLSSPPAGGSDSLIQSDTSGSLSFPSVPNKYFLIVSRLSRFTQYKRVDLAIKACTKLGLSLMVVGDGDIGYFKRFAGKTVTFSGRVSEGKLMYYYQNCKAFIFPGNEDFGLSMVEAQYFGKPIIAYRAGGALEIVKEGKTGMFFNEQNLSSLVTALKTFRDNDYNSEACIKNAERFSFDSFKKNIMSILDS